MRGQEDGEYDAPLLQSRVISATCAALGGALLGVLLSEVVETTMVEIRYGPRPQPAVGTFPALCRRLFGVSLPCSADARAGLPWGRA